MVLSSRLNLPLRIIVNLYLGALSITPWTLFPQRCNLWLAPNAHKCFGGLNSDISPSWCRAGDSQFQGATLNPSMPIPLCFGSPLRVLTYRTTLYLKYHTQSHVLLWKLDFTRYLGNVIDFQSLKKMIVKIIAVICPSINDILSTISHLSVFCYLSAIYLVYMHLSSIISLSPTIDYHLSIICLYIYQSIISYLSSIN